ncbi:MAG: hypothetical protein HC829_06935 [Bacteroidales bacterium]|nr:hypothetical protein [Bacteroidales bacterium]
MHIFMWGVFMHGVAVPVIAAGAAAGVSIALVPGLAGWLGAGLALIMVAIAAIETLQSPNVLCGCLLVPA